MQLKNLGHKDKTIWCLFKGKTWLHFRSLFSEKYLDFGTQSPITWGQCCKKDAGGHMVVGICAV